MKDFLFRNFHETIDGVQNPRLNSSIDYRDKLGKLMSQGIKPHLCYRIAFSLTDKGVEYRGHSRYWHKDHWHIFPETYVEGHAAVPMDRLVAIAEGLIGLNDNIEDIFQLKDGCMESIVTPEIQRFTSSELRFHFYNALFEVTGNNIKSSIATVVSSDINKKQIKRFIKSVQESLLGFCYKIGQKFGKVPSDWHRHISPNLSEMDIYRLMQQYIDDILIYVYGSCADYIDPSLGVPFGLRTGFFLQLEETIMVLSNYVRGAISGHFASKILEELLTTFGNGNRELSFSGLMTCADLLTRCHSVIRKNSVNGEKSITAGLIHEFKVCGLNSPTFTYYLKCEIENALPPLNVAEKVKFLRQNLEEFEKMNTDKEMKYNMGMPTLEEQMVVWLTEMLSFFATAESGPKVEPEVLELNDSVAVLGLILRAFYEVRPIDRENTIKLAQVMSRTVSDKGTADKLLGKNLYDCIICPKGQAVDKAQEYLIKMHDIIEGFRLL